MGLDWGKVVSMIPGDHDGNHFASLQVVRAYWEGLRQADALPRRDRIDPRGIGSALEYVFMLERIAPGVARFRIAGSHLTLLMGTEVRGMPLTALLEPAARDGAMALTETLFSEPAVVEIALEAERGLGRPTLEGRMILLPVLGDEGICDRALGCLVTNGEIGRSPRRFAIARQHSEGLDTLPARFRPPAGPVMQVEAGFAEAPRDFEPPKQAPRGRPHLRLVKSDE